MKNISHYILDELNCLINKVNLFGFHFSTLDIRQNSKIHEVVFKDIVTLPSDLTYQEKISFVSSLKGKLNPT